MSFFYLNEDVEDFLGAEIEIGTPENLNIYFWDSIFPESIHCWIDLKAHYVSYAAPISVIIDGQSHEMSNLYDNQNVVKELEFLLPNTQHITIYEKGSGHMRPKPDHIKVSLVSSLWPFETLSEAGQSISIHNHFEYGGMHKDSLALLQQHTMHLTLSADGQEIEMKPFRMGKSIADRIHAGELHIKAQMHSEKIEMSYNKETFFIDSGIEAQKANIEQEYASVGCDILDNQRIRVTFFPKKNL